MVEFEDVEAMVIAFLREVTGQVVSTKVPKNRPDRFTRAWCTGGGASNRVVERVQITVTCTAAEEIDASDDAKACRHAFLHEYLRMPLVRGRREISRPYSDPDPDLDTSSRYSFTVELTVRAHRA